jgi:hypothetical protein
MLGVDLDGSRRIWPAHVGCAFGPDGSHRMQKDRLDDHRDDQGASDGKSDARASNDGGGRPPKRRLGRSQPRAFGLPAGHIDTGTRRGPSSRAATPSRRCWRKVGVACPWRAGAPESARGWYLTGVAAAVAHPACHPGPARRLEHLCQRRHPYALTRLQARLPRPSSARRHPSTSTARPS